MNKEAAENKPEGDGAGSQPDNVPSPAPPTLAVAERISKNIIQEMFCDDLNTAYSLVSIGDFALARITLNNAFTKIQQLESLNRAPAVAGPIELASTEAKDQHPPKSH